MRAVVLAGVGAALLVSHPARTAHAEGPPPVVYLAEAVAEGNTFALGVVDLGDRGHGGKATTIVGKLPAGVMSQIAVDAATRRWALSFHQLSSGDPLFLDGQLLSEPSGPHVLLTGQLDTPGHTVLAGDPACHSKKRACFETPMAFAAGGQLLLTRSEGSSWWMWNQRALDAGAAAKPVPIVDKALPRAGMGLTIGTDGKRAAYAGKKTGIYVTPWPAPAAVARPPKAKRAKKPVGKPPLVMSELALVGDHVFYFRRKPDDQSGLIAAWDLVRGTEIEVFRFPDPVPVWHHRFLHAPSRGSVFFQHDIATERADLYEVSLTTWQVKKVGGDVSELLDVSPDGRYLVAAAFSEPDPAKRKVFDHALVVIDADTGKVVRRVALPHKLPRLHDARFVAPKP